MRNSGLASRGPAPNRRVCQGATNGSGEPLQRLSIICFSLLVACAGLLLTAQAIAQPAGGAGEPSGEAADKDDLEQAKRLFFEGNKLRDAGDYERALVTYVKSRELVVRVANTMNAAICLHELGRFDEALEFYEELLTKHDEKLADAERKEIHAKMEQLRRRVGSVNVQANVDGTLVIDGRRRGELPLIVAVRVLPGARVVHVIKQGYRSFEQTVVAKVGETVQVHAKLEPLEAVGEVAIDAPALEGAEVFIDGAPVGEVPWEGHLEPGDHRFFIRRGDEGSAPKKFVVVKGQKATLSVELQPLGPEIRIDVMPPTALLMVAEVSVGEGRWRGRLPVGAHKIEAREEGYFDETHTLKVVASKMDDLEIRLRADESHARWGVRESGALWLDAFGAFGVVPSFGSEPESSCSSKPCGDNPAALGFAVGARGGYEFPFRLSVELAGGYLLATKTLTRSIDTEFAANNGQVVPIRYDLDDDIRVSGPFAGGGLGYRLPFASVLELRGHLLVGALFSFSRDTMTATATASGQSVPASTQNSGQAAGGANLFVAPSLELGVRFDGFGIGLAMTAMIVTLEGPAQKNGELTVANQDSCDRDGDPTNVVCAPNTDEVAAESAHSTFVMLLPGLSAGYMF